MISKWLVNCYHTTQCFLQWCVKIFSFLTRRNHKMAGWFYNISEVDVSPSQWSMQCLLNVNKIFYHKTESSECIHNFWLLAASNYKQQMTLVFLHAQWTYLQSIKLNEYTTQTIGRMRGLEFGNFYVNSISESERSRCYQIQQTDINSWAGTSDPLLLSGSFIRRIVLASG